MTMGSLCRFNSEANPFQVVDMWHNKTITGLHTLCDTDPTRTLLERRPVIIAKGHVYLFCGGKDDVPWIMSSSMLWSILL